MFVCSTPNALFISVSVVVDRRPMTTDSLGPLVPCLGTQDRVLGVQPLALSVLVHGRGQALATMLLTDLHTPDGAVVGSSGLVDHLHLAQQLLALVGTHRGDPGQLVRGQPQPLHALGHALADRTMLDPPGAHHNWVTLWLTTTCP